MTIHGIECDKRPNGTIATKGNLRAYNIMRDNGHEIVGGGDGIMIWKQ